MEFLSELHWILRWAIYAVAGIFLLKAAILAVSLAAVVLGLGWAVVDAAARDCADMYRDRKRKKGN